MTLTRHEDKGAAAERDDNRQMVPDAAIAFALLAQEVGIRWTLIEFWFMVEFQGQHRDDRIGRMLRKGHHRSVFIE